MNSLKLHGRAALAGAVLMMACAFSIFAQGPCGGKPCPRIVVPAVRSSGPAGVAGGASGRTRTRSSTPRRGGKPTTGQPRNETSRTEQPVERLPCEDAELVVVCGLPGCEITLNNQFRHVTDELGGFTFQVAASQNYRIRVTKPGYDPFERTESRLDCGDQREVNAALAARPVTLRIRTIPAECDIYLDNVKQPKGSDSQGLFSYLLSKPNLLIEAKKPKHLSKSKSIVLKPELATSEVVLELEPLSATVNVSLNIADVRVSVDNKPAEAFENRLSLQPGDHALTFEALGYSPVTIQIKASPDETINREVRLERLPPANLQTQAENLLARRAFDDVLKLARYLLESDGANGAAQRLIGSVYLSRGDFTNAGTHFARALTVNEPIPLRIRRHAGEKFDFAKGHDLCEGRLILRKTELEFQGVRNSAENFTVPYAQVQVGAVQLKSSMATYVATKVTANGKRRDYNFYSFDKELSAADKQYLEMIQRLLKPH